MAINHHGGAREGAGRPPGPRTLARRSIAIRAAAAEALIELARDVNAPPPLRLQAAESAVAFGDFAVGEAASNG
jgi:hypothetical protein